MNDFLNEGKLQYDAPRYDEMSVFLNHILTIAKSNPNYPLTNDIVYSELEKFTLPGKDFQSPGRPKKVEHLFSTWINRFKNVPNVSVFNAENWKYWCQFVNKSYANEFIKVYVPLDGEGLEDGVNDIFDFLAKHDIHHQSKVGKFLRNDNVVIRLDKGDEKSLRMLIDYINSNPRIKKHMNKTNPFLPSINGIGVMNETGISYNSELCDIIVSYVNQKKTQGKIDVNDFITFAKENMYKKELHSAFTKATSSQPQYFDAKENIYGYVEKGGLTNIQKQTLLNDTIRATYEKYGIHQAVTALMKVITANDYSYFTNGQVGYRDFLRKNVKKDEINNMIKNGVQGIYRKIFPNLKNMIESYCRYYFEDGMVAKLDEMCEVTLENHGPEFLQGSINRYCRTGLWDSFSRFKKGDASGRNYRNNCRYIPAESMLATVRKSLKAKGIDASYISNENLATMYAQALADSAYQINFDEDADMKIYR